MSYLNPSSKDLSFSTYGLKDIIGERSRLPKKAFCSGRCSIKPNYKVRGLGKAKMLSEYEQLSAQRYGICPQCEIAVFWSDKYSVIVENIKDNIE